jgi:hypothetical protein
VTFSFPDSTLTPGVNYATRIEFSDGVRERVVSAADLFTPSQNAVRTPWYRLRPSETVSASAVRVIIEHRGGVRSVAQYPITFRGDEFYRIHAGISNRRRERADGWPPEPSLRGYPLNSRAGAEPGDSLWIFYSSRDRRCFRCPT